MHQEEEKAVQPEISRLHLSGAQVSRNSPIAASVSQEAKPKSESQRQTPKMGPMPAPTLEPEGKHEPLRISQVFDQQEQRMSIMQKDKEIYNTQYRRLTQKVSTLYAQVEEAQQDANKCTLTRLILGDRQEAA